MAGQVGPIYNYSRHVNTYYGTAHNNYNNTTGEFRHPIKFHYTDHGTFFDPTTKNLNPEEKLSSGIIAQLRQNARALIYNFINSDPGTLPSFADAEDDKIEPDDYLTNEQINTTDGIVDPAGSGLLDDMSEGNITALDGGVLPTGVSTGIPITKAKIDEIKNRLEAAANYQNYSNHTNYGYSEYAQGYINHVNSHSNSYRGNFCHRHHSNHTNNGGVTYVNYSKYTTPAHTNTIGPNYSNTAHSNYANLLPGETTKSP